MTGARGPVSQQRFPLAALLEQLDQPNHLELARRLAIQPRTVYRWIHEGGLTPRYADRVACRLNLHPANIWPHEWISYLADHPTWFAD